MSIVTNLHHFWSYRRNESRNKFNNRLFKTSYLNPQTNLSFLESNMHNIRCKVFTHVKLSPPDKYFIIYFNNMFEIQNS